MELQYAARLREPQHHLRCDRGAISNRELAPHVAAAAQPINELHWHEGTVRKVDVGHTTPASAICFSRGMQRRDGGGEAGEQDHGVVGAADACERKLTKWAEHAND